MEFFSLLRIFLLGPSLVLALVLNLQGEWEAENQSLTFEHWEAENQSRLLNTHALDRAITHANISQLASSGKLKINLSLLNTHALDDLFLLV